MEVERLLKFIQARHAIYEARSKGLPKPWTEDKILQSYRFCNMYRELDTETKWLAENWRSYGHRDFWFAALVFRFINWHETADDLGFPVPWNPIRFVGVLQHRKALGQKTYSGAYMISTHGVREDKASYLAKSLTKIWASRDDIRPREGATLGFFHNRLMSRFDIGSFLSGQVIADTKYTGYLLGASDWWTFAASGPGSKRGLNRVLGRSVNAPWNEVEWYRELSELRYTHVEPFLSRVEMPDMHAQDLQNCLCEFDKYERARLGEGRPKATYKGA